MEVLLEQCFKDVHVVLFSPCPEITIDPARLEYDRMNARNSGGIGFFAKVRRSPADKALMPTKPVSIDDEILRIRKASNARNPWAVLDIPPRSQYKQIKSAQRKWIRRLHPDRWHATADEQLRSEIQEAFYQVQSAYFEALRQHAAALQGTAPASGPITAHDPVSRNVEARPLFWLWLEWLMNVLPRNRMTRTAMKMGT
jgi:hypothetical protein